MASILISTSWNGLPSHSIVLFASVIYIIVVNFSVNVSSLPRAKTHFGNER
jgi:hypothetical protein